MTRLMKARAIFWRLMALICVLRAVWDVIEMAEAGLVRVEGGDTQLAIAGTDGLTEEDYAAILADEEGTIDGEAVEESDPMAEAIARLIG